MKLPLCLNDGFYSMILHFHDHCFRSNKTLSTRGQRRCVFVVVVCFLFFCFFLLLFFFLFFVVVVLIFSVTES